MMKTRVRRRYAGADHLVFVFQVLIPRADPHRNNVRFSRAIRHSGEKKSKHKCASVFFCVFFFLVGTSPSQVCRSVSRDHRNPVFPGPDAPPGWAQQTVRTGAGRVGTCARLGRVFLLSRILLGFGPDASPFQIACGGLLALWKD